MAEVFRTLTDGVWSEIADEPDREELEISLIRRNLQREHLRKLSTIVIGQGRDPYGDLFSYVSFYGSQRYPADARSLARQHLKEIAANIEVALERDGVDDTTRAHLEEVAEQIESVLEARLNAAGP